jgi:exonuclease VII large subunit
MRSVLSEARQRLNGIERHEMFRRPTHQIDSLRQFMDDRERALEAVIGSRLRMATLKLERLRSRLEGKHPRHVLALQRQRLREVEGRLGMAFAWMGSTRNCRRFRRRLSWRGGIPSPGSNEMGRFFAQRRG